MHKRNFDKLTSMKLDTMDSSFKCKQEKIQRTKFRKANQTSQQGININLRPRIGENLRNGLV